MSCRYCLYKVFMENGLAYSECFYFFFEFLDLFFLISQYIISKSAKGRNP
jgi:hypothetical protein